MDGGGGVVNGGVGVAAADRFPMLNRERERQSE